MVLKSIFSILPLLISLSLAKELLQNETEEEKAIEDVDKLEDKLDVDKIDVENLDEDSLEEDSLDDDSLDEDSLDEDSMDDEEENLAEQLTALAVEEDSGTSHHSTDLDISNFYTQVLNPETKLVLTDKPWMVKFFAPWCPHCQHMVEDWEELHKRNQSELNVGSVDCTTPKGDKLCKAYHISGFPTIVYMPIGVSEYHIFNGYARTVEQFEKFAL